MNRRRYLALLAGVGLAGCQGDDSDPSDGETPGGPDDSTETATAATPPTTGSPPAKATPTSTTGAAESYGLDQYDLPLSAEDMSRAADWDEIPAITDPVFAEDWSGYILPPSFHREQATDIRLEQDDRVIGVERDGEARAYPLRVLNWHEVVNDTFGGPLLVTYCPLCGSGVTAVRRVDGEKTDFGVSGLLWNSNLVMYDEATESLWSQIHAASVHGEMTGTRLEFVPSQLTTLGEWRETHPGTKVLVPPPESNTIVGPNEYQDYRRNPYRRYEKSSRTGASEEDDGSDDRLHPKTQILGVAHEEAARAYPVDVVTDEQVINDSVSDLPVVVAATPEDRMVAYERTVDGEVLSFETADDPAFLRARGSRWRVTTGRAVDGPHKGAQLSPATDLTSMFWFAWTEFHPYTDVYEG